MKFDGGKVVAPAPDGEMAIRAAAGADLDALVTKTQALCEAMIAEAQAERDQILTQARAERDQIRANIERFKTATRPLAQSIVDS